MPRAAELDQGLASVIGLHQRRQRAALAQRRDVAGDGDGADHFGSVGGAPIGLPGRLHSAARSRWNHGRQDPQATPEEEAAEEAEVAASRASRARPIIGSGRLKVERETGIEPATFSLEG
jgi:hypothetical protein